MHPGWLLGTYLAVGVRPCLLVVIFVHTFEILANMQRGCSEVVTAAILDVFGAGGSDGHGVARIVHRVNLGLVDADWLLTIICV